MYIELYIYQLNLGRPRKSQISLLSALRFRKRAAEGMECRLDSALVALRAASVRRGLVGVQKPFPVDFNNGTYVGVPRTVALHK